MRKIASRIDKEKKAKRNQFIVGVILIVLITLSIIGGAFQGFLGNSDKITYNGFEFIKQGDYWILESDFGDFIFQYNPNEVEEVKGYLNSLNNYYNKPVYIFSENEEAELEIYRNLFYYNKFVQRMQKACPYGERCGENSPVKTCENNFIIIKEEDDSDITQDENCVFIGGKQEDLVKLTDEFLFKILGIR